MKVTVRALADLGEDLILAPERWMAAAESGEGIPLGDLVVERKERADTKGAVVLDTTHAKGGVLDIAAALRAAPTAKSTKKRAYVGDLVVSRLRPYLRQIALVHSRALEATSGRALALSTEFYVLSPRRPVGSGSHPEADDLAFLLPFLLGDAAQAVLASAQEGGHHPRVPRTSLLGLRVPEEIVRRRERISREVNDSLDVLYQAVDRWQRCLISRPPTSRRR